MYGVCEISGSSQETSGCISSSIAYYKVGTNAASLYDLDKKQMMGEMQTDEERSEFIVRDEMRKRMSRSFSSIDQRKIKV